MDLHHRRRTLGIVCLVGLGWLIGSSAAWSFDEPPEKRAFVLHVVDEATGDSIEGATVRARANDFKAEGRTDAKGVCLLDVPTSSSSYYRVYVRKDGFTPIGFGWDDDGESQVAALIPAEHAVSLSKGTTIGGLVHDENGVPIADASVFVSILISVDELPRSGKPWPEVRNIEAKTDAEGRWRCDVVPANLDGLTLRLRHPDFTNDTLYGSAIPSVEKLRDQTAVMAMKKGITVEGRVLAGDGKPIAGAKVAQGDTRFVEPAYPTTTTDNEGKFRFDNSQPGPMILTVQAKGHAPDLRRITVAPDLGSVDFALEPAKRIHGRIVDQQGTPVAGAFVAVSSWRGCNTIDFRVDTDQEGRFAWDDAPTDEVLFGVGKEGYRYVREKPLRASEGEATITLLRPLKVSGGVVDDATGEPIAAFTVTPGIDWGMGRPPSWERYAARRGAEGRYEIDFGEPRDGHHVKIEAEGYLPAVSRSFKDDEGEATFDARLKRGEGVSGLVVGRAGNPAAGASVCLIAAGTSAHFQEGQPPKRRDAVVTQTDQDGRFQFPSREGAFTLVAMNDDGLATLNGAELNVSDVVKLETWGRVEGVIRVGARLAPGETVRLFYSPDMSGNAPQPYFSYTTTTDDDGRYVIERVPPGEVQVAREVQRSNQTIAYTHNSRVEVKPGQTTRVDIGGTGRPVIGRVITLGLASEGRIFRLSSLTPTDAAQRAKPAEQPAPQRPTPTQYAVIIETDGSFHVDDVPAGEYDLRVQVYEPPTSRLRAVGELRGSINRKVEVPEMPEGRSDEPLDLGEIELDMLKRVNIGDAAPGFEAPTLDGGKITLDDFRGKFVLLDFWATWCGPCIAETPNLKDTFEAFGEGGKFAMIGLSLDDNAEAPRKYVEENALGWIQVFLGSFSETEVPSDYGVFAIPSIWLIGPDGKVVAKNLRGAGIKQAIAEALGEK